MQASAAITWAPQFWNCDNRNNTRNTGAYDGTSQRGHITFTIVYAQLEDGGRRMYEKLASKVQNGRPCI